MAKVKINKLPKGFHIVDGKVKKKALEIKMEKELVIF